MNLDAILVGLGNPGPQYSFTRHNVGFLALDMLAADLGARFAMNRKWQSEEARVEWKGLKCLLLKPQTFMNLSGQTVQTLYGQYHHLREKPLVVLHDEVDLPMGRVRVKTGGGDAGHNGLKSLRQCIGNGDFHRVRMGVGRPVQGSPLDLADWVLANFTETEKEPLIGLLARTLHVTETLLKEGLEKAQRVAALP